MVIEDLKNKLVAVLGYAQEGQATARYLLKHGVKPVLFDAKPWDNWSAEERMRIRDMGVTVIFGTDCLKELKGFDVAFRSPGIRRLAPEIVAEERKGMLLTSQTKWFFQHCPARTIGITGTNGKGTTASLVYEILQRKSQDPSAKNQKAYLTGNIGKEQPLDFLDELKQTDWVVYELSSFQLQDLDRSPHIAVVLTVTPDHLDYHASEEEYYAAKEVIVRYQAAADQAVINRDNPVSFRIGNAGLAAKYYFSRRTEPAQGGFVRGDEVYIRLDGMLERVAAMSDLAIRGQHNLENVCAAAIAARLAGAEMETIRHGVQSFPGLPHRLQYVGEYDGVKFYDDSIATTPDPTLAALAAFSESLVVILGGSSKGSDFTQLGQELAKMKNLRGIILVGQEAPRLKRSLEAAAVSAPVWEGATSMTEIFDQVRKAASMGSTVLLSPACASFGMFKNYADRGDQFQQHAKRFELP